VIITWSRAHKNESSQGLYLRGANNNEETGKEKAIRSWSETCFTLTVEIFHTGGVCN